MDTSQEIALLRMQLSALQAELEELRASIPFQVDASQPKPGMEETDSTARIRTLMGQQPAGVAGVYAAGVYAFQSWANAALNGIVMEPGDIRHKAETWIKWAAISGSTTTPAVTSTNVCVWIELDLNAGTAAMNVGTRAQMDDALDSAEEDYKLVFGLVETTWSGGYVTKVENLQCGDIKADRAA